MKACFRIAERSLSYAKIVPASAMKACFRIAERSLSYAKIVPANAMKACFRIAERSLSYAKIRLFSRFYGFGNKKSTARKASSSKPFEP